MNSFMNIQIRVLSAAARGQLKALQSQLVAMDAATGASTKTTATNTAVTNANTVAKNRLTASLAAGARAMTTYNSRVHASSATLSKWGSQVQWTGRQLQRNFTLPLLLAGGAALKFALDNEKAFTHTRKVYGDLDAAIQWSMANQAKWVEGAQDAADNGAKTLEEELGSLQRAFEAISSHYGVQQKQVLEVAGAWAAAGVSGVKLAESVDLTMQAMMLGNIEAGKATESLIAIQAQYNLGSKGLAFTLRTLNAVENQTAISLSGLIDGFARAAGVARSSGIGVRELAAHLAALVPAAGGAGAAGNALKTIYSRLMAPTGETADILNEMGFELKGVAWNSLTAGERLKMLTAQFKNMGAAQRNQAAATIGSRWQLNKLLILLDELGKKNGQLQKAYDATASRSKILAQANAELTAILDSAPNKFQRVWVSIQNGMASAIIPLIPAILSVFNSIRMLVDKFQQLSPEWQKFIMFAGLALAILPLVMIYISQVAVLVGTLGKAFSSVISVIGMATGALVTFGRVMLVTPFKVFMRGLGAVVGLLWMMTTALIKTVGVQVATWAFGYMRMTVLSLAFWTAMIARVKTAWGLMLVIHTVGWTRTAALWLAGYVRLAAISSGAMILANASLLWGAMLLGFKVMFAKIIAATFIFITQFVFIWNGWMNVMRGLMYAFQAWIIAQWYIISGSISLLWVGFYQLMTAISAAGSAALATVHAVAARVIAAGWAALRAALVVLDTKFWTLIIKIWIAGALALPRALAAIRGAIVTAWALIVAAQRTGALAAAAAAAGPWVALGAAVVAIFFALRKQIVQIWNNIVEYFSDSSSDMAKAVLNAWNSLPQGVSNALVAVARVVRAAALQIYEWFSYINPFARHSPSLVDNVTAGMARIKDEFESLGTIGNSIRAAYSEINAFGKAVAGLLKGAQSFEELQNRRKVKKFAPGALDEFDALVSRLHQLKAILKTVQAEMDAQQSVVDSWTDKLEKANAALEKQQDKLAKLEEIADGWKEKLQASQDALESFANAPIEGMKAANDAIFENEMAQKRLRLEMMRMEEVTGPLDDIKEKIEAINGAQELLRGEQADLRNAGAGSDILSGYQAEIDALEQQKQAYEDVAAPLDAMQKQLQELQRQAEIMDLEKSLKFDPLTKAVEEAASAMRELPFDDIMRGIQASQADIAKYSAEWDKASEAVKNQQAVVDAATKKRDEIQSQLDAEEKKLDAIKKKYDSVNDAISAINDTISDVISAADAMAQALEAASKKKGGGADHTSPALENFKNAAGGDFPDVGGAGSQVRKDWESQKADIDKFTSELEAKTSGMFSSLNPFTPIKAKWNEFKSWMGERVTEFKAGFGDMFGDIFGNIDGGGIGKKMGDIFGKIGEFFKSAWDLFGPDIVNAFDGIKDAGKDIWNEIGPELEKFMPVLKDLWNAVKPVVAIIAGALVLALKVVTSVLGAVLGPALTGIIKIIANVIQVIRGFVEIFTGVVNIIIGLITGDWAKVWEGFKQTFHGVYDVVAGVFGAIGHLIAGVINTVISAVWGFVKGIWEFFVWLYDVLVGNSVIPDMIDAIWDTFKLLIDLSKWVWDNVLKPVFDFFVDAFKLVYGLLSGVWGTIKTVLKPLWELAKWVWDNVLQPLWQRFKTGFDDIKGIVEGAGEKIGIAFDFVKTKAGDVLEFIKSLPGKIKDLGENMKEAGKHLIDKFIEGLKKVGSIAGEVAGNLMNAIIGAVNFGIQKVNDMLPNQIGMPKPIPDIDLPDNPFPPIPEFYKGGIVKGSRAGMLAIVGDRGHDEAIIPLDGPYAPGVGLRSDPIGGPGGAGSTINIYGNLEFPNITSGDDAETFITNLEILAAS